MNNKLKNFAVTILATVVLSGCADNTTFDGLPVDLQSGNFARVEIAGNINKWGSYIVHAVNGEKSPLFASLSPTYALPANQPLDFLVLCKWYGGGASEIVNKSRFKQTLSPNKCYVPSGLPSTWNGESIIAITNPFSGERHYEKFWSGIGETSRFCNEVKLVEVDCATHAKFK